MKWLQAKTKLVFRTLFWRAATLGAFVEPKDRWQLYLVGLCGPLMITVVLTNYVVNPEQEVWRTNLGWIMLALSLISTIHLGIAIVAHHRRDKIDLSQLDERFSLRSFLANPVLARQLQPIRLFWWPFKWLRRRWNGE